VIQHVLRVPVDPSQVAALAAPATLGDGLERHAVGAHLDVADRRNFLDDDRVDQRRRAGGA